MRLTRYLNTLRSDIDISIERMLWHRRRRLGIRSSFLWRRQSRTAQSLMDNWRSSYMSVGQSRFLYFLMGRWLHKRPFQPRLQLRFIQISEQRIFDQFQFSQRLLDRQQWIFLNLFLFLHLRAVLIFLLRGSIHCTQWVIYILISISISIVILIDRILFLIPNIRC